MSTTISMNQPFSSVEPLLLISQRKECDPRSPSIDVQHLFGRPTSLLRDGGICHLLQKVVISCWIDIRLFTALWIPLHVIHNAPTSAMFPQYALPTGVTIRVPQSSGSHILGSLYLFVETSCAFASQGLLRRYGK